MFFLLGKIKSKCFIAIQKCSLPPVHTLAHANPAWDWTGPAIWERIEKTLSYTYNSTVGYVITSQGVRIYKGAHRIYANYAVVGTIQ